MDDEPVADDAATDDAVVDVADDDGVETLLSLSELLLQARSDLDGIHTQLTALTSTGTAAAAAPKLKELSTQIPVLGGEIDRLQLKIDAVTPSSDASRKKRKELTAQAGVLTEDVKLLPASLEEAVTTIADRAKADGNTLFKAGTYDRALEAYSLAISIDRKAPVYRSNRSACYQAMGRWADAIADAKECLALDVGFVKGYLHLIKCLLRQKALAEAAKVLQSAPLGMEKNHPELAALAATVRDEIKAAGNSALKQGQHEAAIQHYSLCITLDPTQPVYFSNRSAAHQARRAWREAATDAKAALKLDRLFLKGYLHLSKCQIQLGQGGDALSTCRDGIRFLQEAGQPTATYQPLMDLMKQAQSSTLRPASSPSSSFDSGSVTAEAGGGPASASRSSHPGPDGGSGGEGGTRAERAANLKERGNALYKASNYPEALKLYSQAIGTHPEEGSYYGNRAACWMMLHKYERAVDDCAEGLRREQNGGLYKLRGRQATALIHLGKLERAVDVLQEGVSQGGEAASALSPQLQAARNLQTNLRMGKVALDEGAYAKAKGCFSSLISAATQSTEVLLLAARNHLALGESIDAAREAQKAMALDPDLLPAYVVRADALHKMGQSDKAMKHLREALQRDPDNQEAQSKLKRLKRLVADMESLTTKIAERMSARLFEEAASLCGEALKIAEGDKTLCAPLHAEKAKAYQRLARSRGRGETRREREAAAAAPAARSSGAMAADKEDEEEEDPRNGVTSCWRRCLQECGSAIYADPTLAAAYLLKAEALQQMDRFSEAEQALVALLNADPSKRSDQSILQKVAEAQFLVKKSQRPDLYALLGVKGVGSKASEKEIRQAYKRAALECHPDRFSDKGEAERKEAERKFKELGEALEILTDDFKRKLWDEGHDIESINQQVQMRDQQQRR